MWATWTPPDPSTPWTSSGARVSRLAPTPFSRPSRSARSLLIRGEPGIGKTTLWRHALDVWRRAGREALVARPAEEERALALGGLVDLFEGVGIEEAASRPRLLRSSAAERC